MAEILIKNAKSLKTLEWIERVNDAVVVDDGAVGGGGSLLQP